MEENLMKERKETLLALMNEESYVPMKLKELAILLDIPKSRREELKEVLDALIADGKAGVSKKGKYGKAELFSRTGVFTANPRGFGFVTAEGFRKTCSWPRTTQAAPWTAIRYRLL